MSILTKLFILFPPPPQPLAVFNAHNNAPSNKTPFSRIIFLRSIYCIRSKRTVSIKYQLIGRFTDNALFGQLATSTIFSLALSFWGDKKEDGVCTCTLVCTYHCTWADEKIKVQVVISTTSHRLMSRLPWLLFFVFAWLLDGLLACISLT